LGGDLPLELLTEAREERESFFVSDTFSHSWKDYRRQLWRAVLY